MASVLMFVVRNKANSIIINYKSRTSVIL